MATPKGPHAKRIAVAQNREKCPIRLKTALPCEIYYIRLGLCPKGVFVVQHFNCSLGSESISCGYRDGRYELALPMLVVLGLEG